MLFADDKLANQGGTTADELELLDDLFATTRILLGVGTWGMEMGGVAAWDTSRGYPSGAEPGESRGGTRIARALHDYLPGRGRAGSVLHRCFAGRCSSCQACNRRYVSSTPSSMSPARST